ncbi:MAG: TetR/AcrR family transcriptional regulator [Solirubrobacteraceae bacterium]
MGPGLIPQDQAGHIVVEGRYPRFDRLTGQSTPSAISEANWVSCTARSDKRRVILDAAVRVFARQGFHTCRVSDIADEAGVAYGLVYHYFSSKEAILDTLFLERWDVMLAAIAEADASERSPRDKLHAIAAFIIDSYGHDPELMKVIIVEVTRAANTFGRTHLGKIRDAYAQIAAIVARAQAEGVFRAEITPEFAAQAFYGSIEQVLSGWIFDSVPVGEAELEHAKTLIVETICRGLER